MGLRAKTIRKLKHHYNPLGLTRRLKSYSIKSFRLNKKIEHEVHEIREILNKKDVDQISKLMINTSSELNHLASMTYKEFIYYGVIHKKLITTLKTIIKDLGRVEEEIKKSSNQEIKKININQEIKKIEEIITTFSNEIKIEVRTARDLRHQHETTREGIGGLTNDRGIFHRVKKNAKNLRKDIKMERIIKRKIKHLPGKIRKILNSKSKDKSKEINAYFEDLHKEYKIMNDEVKKLLNNVKLNIRSYFEIIETIKDFKEEYNWLKSSKHYEPFPEEKLNKITKEYNKLSEMAHDHEKAEYLVERFLFGKIKSIGHP